MYKVFRRLLLVFLLLPLGLSAQYKEDILGENFVSRTVKMSDDYDGEVVSTIIKRIHHPDSVKSKSAVLYLHGYNDYFFQKELGDKVEIGRASCRERVYVLV